MRWDFEIDGHCNVGRFVLMVSRVYATLAAQECNLHPNKLHISQIDDQFAPQNSCATSSHLEAALTWSGTLRCCLFASNKIGI